MLELLKKEVELCRLQADIGKQVEEKISKDQRRYFLQVRLCLERPSPPTQLPSRSLLLLASSICSRAVHQYVYAPRSTGTAAVDQEGAGPGEGRQVGAHPKVRPCSLWTLMDT